MNRMNWGIPTRRKIKLRAKITIITLVLFSFVLTACPPLEEDPVDDKLVVKGPLDLNKWMDTLHSIETRGRPVIVDLSECTIPDSGEGTEGVLRRVLEDGSDIPQGYSEKTYVQFNPFSGYWYGKELITSIILPKAATMISHAADIDIKVIPDEDKWKSAFRHFKRLRSVSGENIVLIGNLAFIGCEALEEVKLNRTVKISQFAFYNCTALKSVEFEVAKDILTGAFENCTSLERVTFPYVELISQGAFKNCEKLIEISFDYATKIGEDAFRDCISLESARFRAKPERTTTGHPLQTSGSAKFTEDSVAFYENAMRGCTSLELLDIRYAWNVFFSAGALANIGENLSLYLFDDGGESNGGKTYGHPQSELFFGEIRGSEKNGDLTVKTVTINAPKVTPPENSQIIRVDSTVKSRTGIENYINTVYNGNVPVPHIKITVLRSDSF